MTELLKIAPNGQWQLEEMTQGDVIPMVGRKPAVRTEPPVKIMGGDNVVPFVPAAMQKPSQPFVPQTLPPEAFVGAPSAVPAPAQAIATPSSPDVQSGQAPAWKQEHDRMYAEQHPWLDYTKAQNPAQRMLSDAHYRNSLNNYAKTKTMVPPMDRHRYQNLSGTFSNQEE